MHGSLAGRHLLAALVAVAAIAFIAPVGAGAATTVGSTFDPSSGGGQCQDNEWAIQTTSPSSQYVVPSAGILTSWSFQAGSTGTPTEVKLEVGRTTATADQFLVVGVSAGKSPADNTTPTYTDISIPVHAGDFLGLHSNGATRNCGVIDGAYTVHYLPTTDPAPGGSVPGTITANFRLDVSATLERDCDGDGLGDETEDGDTSSCNPPVSTSPATTAATGPTGQRAAALKKCKKKKSATARTKCKKNANKLPV